MAPSAHVRRRPASRGDAGFTAVEAAIVLPLVLLAVLGVMQAAIYYVARATASSAAQNGADVARLQGNTISDGARSANKFAVTQSGGWLTGVTVSTSTRTPTFVTVTVTGHPFGIIPGFGHLTIRQTATAPVERFTTATGSPP